jgi:hypothetical protein
LNIHLSFDVCLFEGSEAELSVITHIFGARDMTGVELLDLLS